MPIKRWDDTQKLTLLRTALASSSGFNLKAEKVVEHWPAPNEKDKPTIRSVVDQYRNIIRHARDLEQLRQLDTGRAAEKQEEFDADLEAGSATTTPKAAISKGPVTPTSQSAGTGGKSTDKGISTGSKRKRRGKTDFSDVDMASGNETSSGSEAEIDTWVLTRRLNLRRRKHVNAVPIPDDSDKEMDAGTKDYGSADSDGDYDFVEERRKKAKQAARRTRN